MKKTLVWLLFCACFASAVLAQTDCPAIVKAALDAVDAACSATARNQVCYGNIHLQATPQDGKTLTFEKTGDIANVATMKTLELSSMSLDDQSWGVALMKLQANLPDTLPGQNVTVLLFGNVEIDNAVDAAVNLPMWAQHGVNVRLRPNTQASIVNSLKPGQIVFANGRLKDGSWIRVKLDTGAGWVAASFLTTTGDITTLPVVESGAIAFGPMQAFYFKSGVGDRPCAEAPDSGILIQTPKGAAHVMFQINDAEITLGSTVYLQAQPNTSMTVTVVEGQATLTAQGTTMIVPAGSFSTVPLGADGHASGKPEFPKPYDAKPLQTLPLRVKAFDQVAIAQPLTTAQIQAKVDAASAPPAQATSGNTAQNNELPKGGRWKDTYTITQNDCPPPTLRLGLVTTNYPQLIFSADRSTLTFDWGGVSQTFVRVADNVYVTNNPGGYQAVQTITFTSSTTYTNTWRSSAGCTFWYDGTGVYVG